MSGKNSILGLSELNINQISWYFYNYEHLKFHAQVSWAWKKFYYLGPWMTFNVAEMNEYEFISNNYAIATHPHGLVKETFSSQKR